MSCLALALQPSNGSDVLLQTREWFPPTRALIATSAFRQIRLAFATTRLNNAANSSAVADGSSLSTAAADSIASLGDDPLAASSGQLIVGVESRYRVVYRLVNGIYVLGVTIADHDNSVNVFECIHIVNQAVSVIVAACRGVDVTPEKLNRKYAEIYMALDIVLRGVSSIRLAAMLAAMHGEGIAKMVHSALDTENKIRGAESWAGVEMHSTDHQASIEAFSNERFELPPETIAAGDEVAASLAPVASEQQDQKQEKQVEPEGPKDPFALSVAVNKQEELVGEFKKDKSQSTDLTVALAGLEVTTLPPAEATQATRIIVEGFEGDYGGIEFSNEQASLGETFEGFSEAWGGGLDASEFVGPKKIQKQQGLGGLELLQTGDSGEAAVAAAKSAGGAAGTPLENLLAQKTEMKGPEMYIVEQISAEFRESLLARVGLMGAVYLRTLPPKTAGDKETEFSFRVDNTSAVKRFAMQSSRVSSLGNGMFHVRTAPSDEPIPILKYSLLPRLTPVPLRVRLIQRRSGTLLSVMIQYASNPDLLVPLSNVTFTLKLPVDPTLLKVLPKALLNRSERELKWHVPEIAPKDSAGQLRARMPVDSSEAGTDEEMEVVGYVKFSMQGTTSLSGVCLRPASEVKTDFYEVSHSYESGVYICN
uniref:MHD domain-containing protein n=1 Tax=Rhizophora mucronata TaxID=61149 RepID=A0A2P2LRT0_RHIMU